MTASQPPIGLSASFHAALLQAQADQKAVTKSPSAPAPSPKLTPGSPAPLSPTPSTLTPTISEAIFCILPRIDQLSVLPPDLQHILRNLPFFRPIGDATAPRIAGLDDFLADISNVMHIRHYCPGDVVIQEGERARAMFFLIKGIVKVISDDGEINFAELRTGSYFGEIGVLFSVRRTATVTARTKCALAVLTSEDLSAKITRYPQIAEILRARANERYEQLKKEMEKVGRRLEPLTGESPPAMTITKEPSHGCLRELSASRAASRRLSEEGVPYKTTTSPEVQPAQAWASPDDFTTSPLGLGEDIAPPPPSSAAVFSGSESAEDLFSSPASQASSFAARYSDRRRASVAVWSDDRLMQFAQIATEKSPDVASPREKLPPLKKSSSFTRAKAHKVHQRAQMYSVAESRGYGILGRDLMARVLRYLDFRHRMRVRASSMHILRLLLDPRTGLTTEVDLSPWHKRIDDKIVSDVVCFCGQTVRNLSLRNCWTVTDKGLASIAHYAGRGLETLCLASVWDVTDGGIGSMARMCQQLRNIDLSNCRKLSDAGVLGVLDACPAVEIISTSYCKILSDGVLAHPRWRTVRRLNLQRCTGIRDKGFGAWGATAAEASSPAAAGVVGEAVMTDAFAVAASQDAEGPGTPSYSTDAEWHLMDVDGDEEDSTDPGDRGTPGGVGNESAFGSSTAMTPSAPPKTSATAAAAATPAGFDLEELILSDCSFLTDATVSAVAASCHKLQYLSLSFCCALTEAFADELCRGCPQLRALDMSFCGTAVTDANLLALARGLSRLERLSIRGCVQVTEQGIGYLARYAKNLKMLNVSQCRNISDDAVRATGRGWRLLTCQGLVEVDEEGFRKGAYAYDEGGGAGAGAKMVRKERARASTT
ncbi:anaphase-promoting complex subunit Hcn1 [Geranomyces variabilis]|nr:anaphase-promoting complex subunit Hcn1 [Geranomyces variabilis]